MGEVLRDHEVSPERGYVPMLLRAHRSMKTAPPDFLVAGLHPLEDPDGVALGHPSSFASKLSLSSALGMAIAENSSHVVLWAILLVLYGNHSPFAPVPPPYPAQSYCNRGTLAEVDWWYPEGRAQDYEPSWAHHAWHLPASGL